MVGTFLKAGEFLCRFSHQKKTLSASLHADFTHLVVEFLVEFSSDFLTSFLGQSLRYSDAS